MYGCCLGPSPLYTLRIPSGLLARLASSSYFCRLVSCFFAAALLDVEEDHCRRCLCRGQAEGTTPRDRVLHLHGESGDLATSMHSAAGSREPMKWLPKGVLR